MTRLHEQAREQDPDGPGAAPASDPFFELSNELLCVARRDGYFVRVNQRWVDVLGHDREELLSRPFADFIHPDDRSASMKEFAALRSRGETLDFMHRFRHADGSYRWLSWNARASADGRTVYAAARDVTEGRAREQALRAALQDAEQYKRIFNVSNSLAAIASLDGRFLRLNASWGRALGYAISELLARPFIEFVHPDDRAATIEETKKLSDETYRSVNFVNRYRCKDDSYRWLAWTAASQPAEGRIYAVANDVTELYKTREELARRENLLEQMSALASVGGWELDLATMTPNWSEQVYEIHEVDPDYQPSITEAIEFYAPEARPIVESAVQRAIEDGTPWDFELPFITAKGRRLWVRALGKAEFRDRKAVRLVGAFQDVTHRKEVEEIKREFVSIVSHELRTPLTSIRGSLRLLEAGVVGDLPDRARELVEIASSNSERLIRLIGDILDVEKIEAGKLDLNVAPIGVAPLIEEAVETMAGMARDHGIRLSTELKGDHEVAGDRDRLIQVLTNLLSNAIKFSPNGSTVELRAKPSEPRNVRFEVTDQGPGVADEDKSKLFEKFQQIDASDTRSKSGTGLGLAICKAIVEQHGGEIDVETAQGRGATFWFEIARIVDDELDVERSLLP